jgi:predicted CoA-binding protein
MIYIYSYKIAKKLLKNGFNIKDILPNLRIKNRTVFVFERTPAIELFLEKEGIKIT